MDDFNLTPEQANKLSSHLQQRATEDFNIDLGPPKIVSSDEPVQAPKPLVVPEEVSEFKKDDIRKRIADVEKEYYGGVGVSPSSIASVTSYKDEYGNDTYYVKNISDGHVTIKDPDLVIPKGKVMDLLQFAGMEELQSCRDIRVAMSPTNRMGSMLKRLTQREYLEEMEKELSIKKRIDIVRQQESLRNAQNAQNPNNRNQFQNNPVQEQQGPKIRPLVLGKVEKLRLSSDPDPDNAKYGINPAEFIQWVMGEFLSDEELDYLLGDPVISNKHDIKAAIVEKKTIM